MTNLQVNVPKTYESFKDSTEIKEELLAECSWILAEDGTLDELMLFAEEYQKNSSKSFEEINTALLVMLEYIESTFTAQSKNLVVLKHKEGYFELVPLTEFHEKDLTPYDLEFNDSTDYEGILSRIKEIKENSQTEKESTRKISRIKVSDYNIPQLYGAIKLNSGVYVEEDIKPYLVTKNHVEYLIDLPKYNVRFMYYVKTQVSEDTVALAKEIQMGVLPNKFSNTYFEYLVELLNNEFNIKYI